MFEIKSARILWALYRVESYEVNTISARWSAINSVIRIFSQNDVVLRHCCCWLQVYNQEAQAVEFTADEIINLELAATAPENNILLWEYLYHTADSTPPRARRKVGYACTLSEVIILGLRKMRDIRHIKVYNSFKRGTSRSTYFVFRSMFSPGIFCAISVPIWPIPYSGRVAEPVVNILWVTIT